MTGFLKILKDRKSQFDRMFFERHPNIIYGRNGLHRLLVLVKGNFVMSISGLEIKIGIKRIINKLCVIISLSLLLNKKEYIDCCLLYMLSGAFLPFYLI